MFGDIFPWKNSRENPFPKISHGEFSGKFFGNFQGKFMEKLYKAVQKLYRLLINKIKVKSIFSKKLYKSTCTSWRLINISLKYNNNIYVQSYLWRGIFFFLFSHLSSPPLQYPLVQVKKAFQIFEFKTISLYKTTCTKPVQPVHKPLPKLVIA